MIPNAAQAENQNGMMAAAQATSTWRESGTAVLIVARARNA